MQCGSNTSSAFLWTSKEIVRIRVFVIHSVVQRDVVTLPFFLDALPCVLETRSSLDTLLIPRHVLDTRTHSSVLDTQQHTYFGVGYPCLSTKELLAHARVDPAGAESPHSAPPWGIRAIFQLATLEATQGQIDGFFSQPPYKCHHDRAASVVD